MKVNVLAISYGRNLFKEGDPERTRMIACAEETAHYHMIVFTREADGFETTEVTSGLTIHPTNSRSKLGMIIDAIRIGCRLIRAAQDKSWVVTAQDPFEAGLVGYLIARLKRVPLNIQEHGDFYSLPHWRGESTLNRARAWLGTKLLRRANSIRTVSKRITATLLGQGVKPERISELSVFTHVDRFTPKTERVFDPGTITVLSVARFVPQKNLPLLLEAFFAARREISNLKLRLVGAGPLTASVEAMLERNEYGSDVTIEAWSSDVPGLMATADIYALSSNYEGWARVLIEAMAAGLPIVTTDVGCVGEVCLKDEHALVTSVADRDAFARALISLAEDAKLRKQFSLAGQEAAKTQRKTSELYAQEWATILEQTLPGKV